MGTLYVVATPIGNLEDITLRALRVLRSVRLIAAEDTRTTRKLLAHYDIKTPVTSYFEHNKLTKIDYLLDVLREGDVAVVSEAGTPGISDPGFELIRAVIAAGYRAVPVPGPSAVIAALAVSGLPTDTFTYIGFLPRKRADRLRRIKEIAGEPRTIVVFEAPHRLIASLEDIAEVLGDRRIAIARELTKVHEEVIRGTVREAIRHFVMHPPRGEFCLVIEGARLERAAIDTEKVKMELATLVREGVSAKEAIARVAARLALPRREVYRLWLKMRRDVSELSATSP